MTMAKKEKKLTEKLEMPVPVGKPSEDYEAKDAFDTLLRAHDIQSKPELMNRVHKHAKKHKKVIKSLDDLKRAAKSRRDELANEEDGAEEQTD
jgi:hypothetical protein